MYLSEPDVASAYRSRHLFGVSQEQLAARREEEFLATLDGSAPWLVLTAVPDLAGLAPVDQTSLAVFRDNTVGRRAGPPWGLASQHFERARVGHRRMYADGGASLNGDWLGRSQWCALEVHADGSGCYAHRVVDLRERTGSGLPRPEGDHCAALDSHAAEALVAGLTWLGEHAWRAGAAGMLNLRATLWPVTPKHPMALGHLAQLGFREEHGPPVTSTIPASTCVPISRISEPGPELMAAAAILLRDIAQNFGVPELGLLCSTGAVRSRYWDPRQRQRLAAWCAQHGIELSDELLT